MSTIVGFKTTPYPLDALGASASDLLSAPLPPYPSYPSFSRLISRDFYTSSLDPVWPLGFSLAYYLVSHAANRLVVRNGGRDLSKGPSPLAAALRLLIPIHNAVLAAYSAWTFAMMAPLVVDFFVQGWRGARFEGVKLALCSMPTNHPDLGRYAYLFYLSKYYEVVDSLILLLKGKKISNLQSYHHAGAIICMWIAYRYQSQPVWVFCVFNSFVHTLMYTYYFCSAMHWPFPKTLKRNLTTLQIAQIASGTLLTNLYLVTVLDPSLVARGLLDRGVRSSLPAVAASSRAPSRNLVDYALARTDTSDPSSCLQTTGAEIALNVNTAYMFPLLALFFRFFMRSYLDRSAKGKRAASAKQAANGAATSAAAATTSNGHASADLRKRQ
ncbi:uncharacterized protein PFL1_04590 [Pseudozyma flocculosa PF-1]|uniref:Elongation of fatty acids protein n=2 Tax=Pseudozyma flocculosa TaxID=84751 RepID=A0A5C3FA89_9BASI|nr:uncharacterized protein PFL1_04590 [Pseudozyma flocculosa PF-1]EPQ27846.1 hypothetical protein PFL1_04590 [Pseudozyma flocculosa PF-1]SPO41026.1 related to ELO1 - Elongase I [Pseudozyma flocculosa]